MVIMSILSWKDENKIKERYDFDTIFIILSKM